MPALAITRSSPPDLRSSSRTAASVASPSETSSRIGTMLSPASALSASRFSIRRAAAQTLMPRCASQAARPRPMPLEAPVTSAFLYSIRPLALVDLSARDVERVVARVVHVDHVVHVADLRERGVERGLEDDVVAVE